MTERKKKQGLITIGMGVWTALFLFLFYSHLNACPAVLLSYKINSSIIAFYDCGFISSL
jgi:hypothetical protein